MKKKFPHNNKIFSNFINLTIHFSLIYECLEELLVFSQYNNIIGYYFRLNNHNTLNGKLPWKYIFNVTWPCLCFVYMWLVHMYKRDVTQYYSTSDNPITNVFPLWHPCYENCYCEKTELQNIYLWEQYVNYESIIENIHN